MRTPPWKEWPAQAPPDGFASRTVDALLREHAKVVKLRRRRRWFLVFGCAAALVAGTSWAMIRASQESQPVLVNAAEEPVPSAEVSTLRFVPKQGEQVPSSALAPPVVAPSAQMVRLPASTSAPASATASASAPTEKTIVPRCTCEPGTQICACMH